MDICQLDAECCRLYLEGRQLRSDSMRLKEHSAASAAKKREALKKFIEAARQKNTAFLKARICSLYIDLSEFQEAAAAYDEAERLQRLQGEVPSQDFEEAMRKLKASLTPEGRLKRLREIWKDPQQQHTPELQLQIAQLKSQMPAEREFARYDYEDLKVSWRDLPASDKRRIELARLCQALGRLCPDNAVPAPAAVATTAAAPAAPATQPASQPALPMAPQPAAAPKVAAPLAQPGASVTPTANVTTLQPSPLPGQTQSGETPTANVTTLQPSPLPGQTQPGQIPVGLATLPAPNSPLQKKRLCQNFWCGFIAGACGTVVVVGVVLGGVIGARYAVYQSSQSTM